MDARRQEAYTGAYEFVRIDTDDKPAVYRLNTIIEEQAIPLKDMLSKLEETGRKVIFNGDGVPVYIELIAENLKTEYSFAPSTCLYQRAASVAAIGEQKLLNGDVISADAHTPIYLRKSQAEREMEA